MSEQIVIDVRGEQCPIPVVRVTKALAGLSGPAALEVHVDNEIAVQNLTRLAQQKNLELHAEKKDEKHFIVKMLSKGQTVEAPAEAPCCVPDSRGNTVVAIGSSTMGSGDDVLGKTLMKGFLYALTQLPVLPRTIIFYNGGAYLTTEGSDSIEDLKILEAQGVEILTCGTCLNFYNLAEKLRWARCPTCIPSRKS
jgi:selenium metabolism protein YedF